MLENRIDITHDNIDVLVNHIIGCIIHRFIAFEEIIKIDFKHARFNANVAAINFEILNSVLEIL